MSDTATQAKTAAEEALVNEAALHATPEEIHEALMSSKGRMDERRYDVGVLLRVAYGQQIWRELKVEPAYESWEDYATRALQRDVETLKRYAEAASFSKASVMKHKVRKMAFLRRIIDGTPAEETEQEALALELPLRSGGTKRFEDMTSDEVEQAHGLLLAKPARPKVKAEKPVDEEARALERRGEAAVEGLLTPDKVEVKRKKGALVLEIATPFAVADAALAALAGAMDERQQQAPAEPTVVLSKELEAALPKAVEALNAAVQEVAKEAGAEAKKKGRLRSILEAIDRFGDVRPRT
ncbi:MAG: hypothetical protein HY928_09680 [Elusimicrobia bacterium]|nr:hypothetical protein [Elusimicrobiota bacterium]